MTALVDSDWTGLVVGCASNRGMSGRRMLDDEVDAFGVFCSGLAMLEAPDVPLKLRLLLKLASDMDDREKVWVILDRTWRARDDLEVCDFDVVGG